MESDLIITGPVFVKLPKHQIEFLNTKDINLDCLAFGNPDPTVWWYKQDGQHGKPEILSDVPGIIKIQNNGSLLFRKFNEENYRREYHSALYKCQASNIYGKIVSQLVSVRASTVRQQQQFHAQVHDEYVIEGNIAVLKCNIPTFFKDDLEIISWIREDNFIIKKDQQKGDNVDIWIASNGNLYLQSLSSKIDLKLGYWCQVRNTLTDKTFLSQTAGRVRLTEPKSSLPSTIMDISKTVYSQKEAIVILNCAAQGYPPPTYKWILKTSGKTIGTSTILKVTVSESTTYTCVVHNRFGESRKDVSVVIKEKLSISISPSVLNTRSGSMVTFTCEINGSPVDEISWYHNGEKIPNEKSGKLQINSVSRKDEGMYQCFVGNKFEVQHSVSQLQLGEIEPKFLETFSTMQLQPGPSVTLGCSAEGKPKPKIYWTVNGNVIKGNDRFIMKDKNVDPKDIMIESKLVIESVDAMDGGLYSCTATNKFKSISHSDYLHVYGLPRVHKMKNLTFGADTDARINCYVSGYPIEMIKWEKGGIISNLPKNSIDHLNGTLVINNIKKKHSGEYICIANNGKGQIDKKAIHIYVQEKPKLYDMGHKSLEVEERNPLSIICSLMEGDEPLRIYWERNNQPIKLGIGADISTTKTYSVLQIGNVGFEHSGNYTCTAQNNAGKDFRTIEVNVWVSPKWYIVPTNKTSSVGKTIMFDCAARGNPEPKIEWFKLVDRKVSNSFLKNQKNRVFHNGSLLITKLSREDSGKYSCIASNGIGDDIVVKTFLTIKDLPEIIFITKSSDILIGDNITLECQSKQATEMKWIKMPKMKNSEIRQFKKDGIITIFMEIYNFTTKNNGMYVCESTNMNGKDTKNLYLSVSNRIIDVPMTSSENSLINNNDKTVTSTDTYDENIFGSIQSSRKPKSDLEVFTEQKNRVTLDDKSFDDNGDDRTLGSSHFEEQFNFNALMFIIPVTTIVILFIAVIATLIAYCVTKRSNTASRNQNINLQDDLMVSMNRKMSSTPSSTVDRRYGRLERPTPMQFDNRNSKISNGYEIPDYYSGMKPYATLQLSSRQPIRPNFVENRESQASV